MTRVPSAGCAPQSAQTWDDSARRAVASASTPRIRSHPLLKWVLLPAVLATLILPGLIASTADARSRNKHLSRSDALRVKNVPLPVRAPARSSHAATPTDVAPNPATPGHVAIPSATEATPAPAVEPPIAQSTGTPPPPTEIPETSTDQTVRPTAPASQDAAAAQTPAIPLPPRLENPETERVRSALSKHCARCHQYDALEHRLSPEGGIANILSLDAIAANPVLIRPGEPDASPLYQQMIAQQMPFDVLRQGTQGDTPDAAEMRAVRAWIKNLDRKSRDACAERAPITSESLGTAIAQWLSAVGPEHAADTRFISLAHVYEACASDAELAAHRQGITTILNSLSWSTTPVAVETVGETLAVLSVRLSDLGWTSDHWEELAGRVPPAARLDLPDAVRHQTHTDIPLIAGHWLAHQIMQPELYARLLGLPRTLDDLARILGIHLDDGRESRTVRRGMALDSRVTGGSRIIERYRTARGAMWIAHDYAEADDQSVLDFPLLPWAAPNDTGGSAEPPDLLGSRALFPLPNGMPAFMLFDDTGAARTNLVLPIPPPFHDDKQEKARIENSTAADTNQPVAAPPPTRPHVANKTATGEQTSGTSQNDEATSTPVRHRVSNGLSCSGCHAMGPLTFTEELADHLAGDDYRGNAAERDIARQVVIGERELPAAIASDRAAAQRAHTAMGVDPNTRIDGQAVATGLAARYTRDLDLATAAAEMLTPTAQLQARLSMLSRAGTPLSILATQLMFTRLTRDEFEFLRPALLGDHTSSGTVASITPTPVPTPQSPTASTTAAALSTTERPPPAPGMLQLWPDKISFSRNDRIVLNVRTGRTCHLTLVNIDNAGRATVLFPNEFARDNLLKANEIKRLPATDALYYFSLQHPGTETFLAICEVGEPVPAGIRHDLTHMNFTELGDWEAFLDTSVKAAREPRVPLNNGDDIDRRSDRRTKPRPAPALSPVQSRAAITVTIAP